MPAKDEDRVYKASAARIVFGLPLDPERRKALLDVTKAVIVARKSYDAGPIINRLAEDAVYESQDTMNPLTGREDVSSYLLQRFAKLEEMTATQPDLDIHPGEVALPEGSDYPCVIFSKNGINLALWVVSLDDKALIKRLDVLTIAPSPEAARCLED